MSRKIIRIHLLIAFLLLLPIAHAECVESGNYEVRKQATVIVDDVKFFIKVKEIEGQRASYTYDALVEIPDTTPLLSEDETYTFPDGLMITPIETNPRINHIVLSFQNKVWTVDEAFDHTIEVGEPLNFQDHDITLVFLNENGAQVVIDGTTFNVGIEEKERLSENEEFKVLYVTDTSGYIVFFDISPLWLQHSGLSMIAGETHTVELESDSYSIRADSYHDNIILHIDDYTSPNLYHNEGYEFDDYKVVVQQLFHTPATTQFCLETPPDFMPDSAIMGVIAPEEAYVGEEFEVEVLIKNIGKVTEVMPTYRISVVDDNGHSKTSSGGILNDMPKNREETIVKKLRVYEEGAFTLKVELNLRTGSNVNPEITTENNYHERRIVILSKEVPGSESYDEENPEDFAEQELIDEPEADEAPEFYEEEPEDPVLPDEDVMDEELLVDNNEKPNFIVRFFLWFGGLF